ncbi:Y-family DNA polymerase [Rhodohalobacter sp. 8-1]|uniref:Y-family DNA polymerase n=1 Tax=Rhodohalobacter sp. 8-1 TaxID=3131972 RepID=UPI0030EC05BA
MYYALIDCNNFYASCERVFDPALQNRPVTILSNNDGCVIARSAEAKELEIPMGIPEFKIRPLIRKYNVAVRSSNYALYGDMSRRVMETLQTCTPNLEVYSIDEAFAELSSSYMDSLEAYGQYIRKRVLKWTGIPVSVGIASTKTLAKLANETAKKYKSLNGVLVLDQPEKTEKVLRHVPVGNVWGIGRNYTKTLEKHGIQSAFDLSLLPDSWIRQTMKVTGLRTVWELRGKPCLTVEQTVEPRKGILSSRSFGQPVRNREDLNEAVTLFASRAAEKLRAQQSVASTITVTLVTSKYANEGSQYKFGLSVSLPNATADTTVFSSVSKMAVNRLFDPSKTYKKAWVMLTGIVPENEIQANLFTETGYSSRMHKLMESMDAVNARYGKQTMGVAGAGVGENQSWRMKQEHLSSRYTTRWDELMEV